MPSSPSLPLLLWHTSPHPQPQPTHSLPQDFSFGDGSGRAFLHTPAKNATSPTTATPNISRIGTSTAVSNNDAAAGGVPLGEDGDDLRAMTSGNTGGGGGGGGGGKC